MTKSIRALPFFLVFWACVATAAPQVAEFSPWEFSSYTTPSGKSYCAILTAVRNIDIGQNVVVKDSPGGGQLVVDLYYDKWNRVQGTQARVTFDFGQGEPLTLPAYADGKILDVQVPVQHTASFLLELAERPLLKIAVPGGLTWSIAGREAKTSVDRLVTCLRGTLTSSGISDDITTGYSGFNPGKWSLYSLEIGMDFNEVLKAFPGKWLELKDNVKKQIAFYSVEGTELGVPRAKVFVERSKDKLIVTQVEINVAENDIKYGKIAHVIETMELLLGTAIHFRGDKYDRLWVDVKLGKAIRVKKSDFMPKAFIIILSKYGN